MPAHLQLPIARALVSVDAAKAILDISEDHVLQWIESGRIRYAFDLACNAHHRRTLRILTLSIYDYITGRDTQPPDLAGAVRYVMPGSSPELTCGWLSRKWNVSASLIHELLNKRRIEEVKIENRGKTNDRMLLRSSAVKFLILRRIA